MLSYNMEGTSEMSKVLSMLLWQTVTNSRWLHNITEFFHIFTVTTDDVYCSISKLSSLVFFLSQ